MHKIKKEDIAVVNVASIYLLQLQRDFVDFNLGEGKKWVSRGLIKRWAKAAAVQVAPLHKKASGFQHTLLKKQTFLAMGKTETQAHLAKKNVIN